MSILFYLVTHLRRFNFIISYHSILTLKWYDKQAFYNNETEPLLFTSTGMGPTVYGLGLLWFPFVLLSFCSVI